MSPYNNEEAALLLQYHSFVTDAPAGIVIFASFGLHDLADRQRTSYFVILSILR
ncbi:MAG: hypothetical protein IJR13_05025 [Bacteroidales bacterium]|nr:hypothetical protein [Bacteroidales bacterium]